MALKFWLRDKINPPRKLLHSINVGPGMTVLDFGCGPGGFTIAAAEIVGHNGSLLAVDIHPLAKEYITRDAAKKGLENIIVKNDLQDIPQHSVDVVLFYDIIHILKDPIKVVSELAGVLKFDGILSVSDHHLEEKEIISKVMDCNLFEVQDIGKKSIQFRHKSTKGNNDY